jgi:hypothetical protein
MPARPSHLPTTPERVTLQRMLGGRVLLISELDPAGKQTVRKLMTKGWIALHQMKPSMSFRITPAGEAAMKAKIPVDTPKRFRFA